ncbi:MAG: CBS domain-containing protein [Magnetococcales bacterium]|nr:CBS domain-containing protein [Magnetococcales bacterium]
MGIVRDWMFSNIATLAPSSTLLDAMHTMVRQGPGFAVVLDDMRLTGLVTGFDLTRWMVEGRDPETTRLADLRISSPLVVYEETPTRELLRLYNQRRFRRFPVLNRDDLLSGGIMEKQILASLPRSNLLAHYRVADVMVPDPPLAPPGLSFMELARRMVAGHRGCVLLEQDQRLAGFITERDLLRHRLLPGWRPDQPIDPLLDREPATIDPETTLLEAVDFFVRSDHRRLPVVDRSGRLWGLITQTSLLQRMATSTRSHQAVLDPEEIREPALWFSPAAPFQLLALNDKGATLLETDVRIFDQRTVREFAEDPDLWGAIATLLRHCPTLGPLRLTLRTGRGERLCASSTFSLIHTPAGEQRIFWTLQEAGDAGQPCAVPGAGAAAR